MAHYLRNEIRKCQTIQNKHNTDTETNVEEKSAQVRRKQENEANTSFFKLRAIDTVCTAAAPGNRCAQHASFLHSLREHAAHDIRDKLIHKLHLGDLFIHFGICACTFCEMEDEAKCFLSIRFTTNITTQPNE